MILLTHSLYRILHGPVTDLYSKEGVAQTSSLRSPLAARIAASAVNDVDQANLPAGECREVQVTAGTTNQVHGKGRQVKGRARYLLPAGALLFPDFLKLQALLTGSALARCLGSLSATASRTFISSISALLSSLSTSLIHDHGFQSIHQEFSSSKSPRRLVALSPLFVLCLPRLSLRICIAQVGPLRLSRPFSPSILCVFFLFPSLSRISPQVPEHLQRWVTLLLV